MAIKYKCDVCGEVNNPSDTYGPGVAPEGRNLVWTSKEPGREFVGLTVMPTTEGDYHHPQEAFSHTCGKCLGKALARLVEEMWPTQITDKTEVGNVLDSGSDSSGSDVREVRPEPEMPGTGPDVYHSPGTGTICPNCEFKTYANPPPDCPTPEFHRPRRSSGAFGGQER